MFAAGRYLLFFLTLAGYYSVFVLFASFARECYAFQQRQELIINSFPQTNRGVVHRTSPVQFRSNQTSQVRFRSQNQLDSNASEFKPKQQPLN
jgi:hypothetical protein